MTSADNKFFARAMTNRFWYQLFGRGLVNPVDDMHDDNAASHPELLATLTEQFKLNGFDVKYLIRSICNSDVYQRTSSSKMTVASVEPDLYSRREMRVLTPEHMYDSLATILGGESRGEARTKTTGKKGPSTPRDVFVAFFRVEDSNPIEYPDRHPTVAPHDELFLHRQGDGDRGRDHQERQNSRGSHRTDLPDGPVRQPTAREVERLTAYVSRPGSTPRASMAISSGPC